MSLSQVLKTFSNSTENLKYTYSGEDKDTVKYLMKSSSEYRDTINDLYINRNKSYATNLRRSQEAFEESLIISTIMSQSMIDRSRKINSLKAMRASGASLEQLSNVASLYSLESAKGFIAKMIQGVQKILHKIITMIKNIIAAIVKFFRTLGPDQLLKDAKKLVAEKPDAIVVGFKTKTSIKDTVSGLLKTARAINQRLSAEDLAEQLSAWVKKGQASKSPEEQAKIKEEANKIKENAGDVIEEFRAYRKTVEDIDFEEEEMKASEFLTDDKGLYLVSKSFQADMKEMEGITKKLNNRVERTTKVVTTISNIFGQSEQFKHMFVMKNMEQGNHGTYEQLISQLIQEMTKTYSDAASIIGSINKNLIRMAGKVKNSIDKHYMTKTENSEENK